MTFLRWGSGSWKYNLGERIISERKYLTGQANKQATDLNQIRERSFGTLILGIPEMIQLKRMKHKRE